MDGVCRLTGDYGRFVKSHIIPQAFTRPVKGFPLAQAGEGQRPTKRWSSWYDPALVTRKGEDILAELDSWAARELRRLQMTWSSWQGKRSLEAEIIAADDHRGLRVLETDGSKLRLFLLSVLWRSAETTLPAFANIAIDPDQRERLRQAVLQTETAPPGLFPVSLTQITTSGPRHNMSPIPDVKLIPRAEPLPPEEFPIFRFFFDGLVAHFHRGPNMEAATRFGPMIVGAGSQLAVTTVTFEASWQLENMLAVVEESEHLYPNEIARRIGGHPFL